MLYWICWLLPACTGPDGLLTEEEAYLEGTGYQEQAGEPPTGSTCQYGPRLPRGEGSLSLVLYVKTPGTFAVNPSRAVDGVTMISSSPQGYMPGHVPIFADDQLHVYRCRGERWEWMGRLDIPHDRPARLITVDRLVQGKLGKEWVAWEAEATILPSR